MVANLKQLNPRKAKLIFMVLMLVLVFPERIYSQCSQLVWQDEFIGSTLDLSKWSYQTGNGTNDNLPNGWGNNELEYYTSRSQNIRVTGGNLEITALYEPNYLGSGLNYTSARIRSTNTVTNNPRNEWKYGSFEARIKVPEPFADSRAWPGFWMLPHNGPWPNTGEIDIMETGNDNNPWYYNGTLHYGSSYPGFFAGTGGVTVNTSASCPGGPVGDLSKCFHIYRCDWSPNAISFFVDNVKIGTTYNSSTTGTGGQIGTLWPFDNNGPFHLLLNMAVGGYFPGSTGINNARFPLTMQVDYVRVYSTPAAVTVNGKTKILQGQTGVKYNVANVSGNTYNWTVPSGATITAGQGTNEITVDYGFSAVSGNVSVTITPSGGGCTGSTNSLNVSVLANACTLMLENFESSNPPTRNLGFNFATGWLNRSSTTAPSFPNGTYANPSATGINTSANVGKYERNLGVQYDVLAYNDIVIGNADDFKKGVVKFNMDVYSTAPAGTTVMVQLENAVNAQTGWPNGIHSRYSAVTGAPNTWSTLQFTLLDAPDVNMPSSDVNQMVLLFNPNTYTNHIYYFDNFKRAGVTPTTSAITGQASVCQNNAGVKYSVTGFANSNFNWTVPSGATIVSGQGTNSIIVNFGTTSGNVTVTETSSVNCVGPTKTQPVSVTGACVLTADFSANKVSTCAGGVITFTDLTSGKTGGETYSWDFGAGASLPAGTTGTGPFNVSYSTGGTKTVVLTVSRSGSTNTQTKTNYITISAPPTGCLFADDYNNSTVNWIAPIPGAFTHAEAGTAWTVSNAGYSEWENFTYTLNNGSVAAPQNFGCGANAPVLKIRAKASANALLRIQMMDGNGLATDNVPGFNLELTTTYQTFTINYAGALKNNYSVTPPTLLDTTNITKLQFFINPGYVSYPYVGSNKTYSSAFSGTVDIDWIGIGNNCYFPGTAPTITSFNPSCGNVGSPVTITGTNLTGSTVTINGINATVTSNTATQIVATVPAGITSGKINVTNAGGAVVSAANFGVNPTTTAITGNATPCANGTGVAYSVTTTAGSTYAWTLPTGSTIATGSGTGSITVNFGSTAGNVSVVETNSAGCVGTAQSKAITFNTAPATPGTITGSVTPCQGAATTYSITAVSGAASYTWTTPSGWTGTSTTVSLSTTPSATAGNVSVTATNTCGTSPAATLAITPKAAPATPGTINGNATPCQGTPTTYSINAVSGAASYTWTLPSGWSGTSTSTSITTTPGTSAGNITVTATNTCGTSTAATLAVTPNTTLTSTGVITGSATPCQGAATTYSIAPVVGATSYTWTLPSGWSGTSTTTSISATPGTSSGNVSVTATLACGTSTPATLAVTPVLIPATPGAISGSATPCQNVATTYSISAVSGATTYIWTLPSGWTGTSTSTSISATPNGTSGNITVKASNGCGTSTAGTLGVTPATIPGTPGAVSGSTAPCQATTSTYSVTPVAGAVSYTWTMPSGWTGSSTTQSISATASATSGNISVTATNACGTSSASSLAVVPGPSPATPGAITGSATPCQGTATTYSIATLVGATSYTWTLPSGWTGNSTTASISVTPSATSGNVSVTATYACGTSSASTKAVTPNPLPGTPATISGATAPCAGTATTYSIASVANAISYTWTLPSGWSGTSTTTSISATPNGTAGNITVSATNGCGASAAVTLGVTPRVMSVLTINGQASVCANAVGKTYSVQNNAGSVYNWTVPSGATITAGSGSNSITVTFGTTGGNISVVESNSGCTGTQATLPVSINVIPNTSAISGSTTPACSSTSNIYSVTATANSTYSWTVPAGAVITSGANSSSITVSFGTSNGNITVTETNVSGCVGATKTLGVTLTGCSLSADFLGTPLNICAGQTVTFTNVSTGVSGSTTYSWNFGAGASPATATTAGPHTVTYTTSGSKTVTLQVTEGATKTATKTNYVNVDAQPSTAEAGGNQTITTSSTTLSGNTPAIGVGTWTIVSGSGTIANYNNPTSQVTGLAAGDNIFRWTIVNNSCSSSDDVLINVNIVTIGTISGPTSVEPNIAYTYSITASGAFTWTVPAGATIVSGQGTNTITVIFPVGTSGEVSVTNGNSRSATNVTVNNPNGVSTAQSFSYELSPNPFQEEAMFRINSANSSRMNIKVMDMHGVLVYSTEEYASNDNIYLGKELAGGVYSVIVYYDDKVATFKMIKVK